MIVHIKSVHFTRGKRHINLLSLVLHSSEHGTCHNFPQPDLPRRIQCYFLCWVSDFPSWTGFLSFGTMDIWGWGILYCGGCLVQWRLFISMLDLFSLDSDSNPSLNCNNQKYLQTWPTDAKITPFENQVFLTTPWPLYLVLGNGMGVICLSTWSYQERENDFFLNKVH